MSIDIEAALTVWVNTNTVLSGPGMPLAKGLLGHRPRSPGRSCYATLSVDDAPDGIDAEGITVAATVTFTVWSATDRTASRIASLALRDELITLSRTAPVVGSARLLMASDVGWPEYVDDDSSEYRHTVEATVYASPSA